MNAISSLVMKLSRYFSQNIFVSAGPRSSVKVVFISRGELVFRNLIIYPSGTSQLPRLIPRRRIGLPSGASKCVPLVDTNRGGWENAEEQSRKITKRIVQDLVLILRTRINLISYKRAHNPRTFFVEMS